jgi:hypothetical protein
MMTRIDREKVLGMRREGYLYSEIALRLSISKSSAYLYCSNVEFSDNEKRLIQLRLGEAKDLSMLKMKQANIAKH